MEFVRSTLKNIKFFRALYALYKTAYSFFNFRPILLIKKYFWFFSQFKSFQRFKNNSINKIELYPCLFDNSVTTPLDPVYFFQDTWAAKHLFTLCPSQHFDIGSSATTVGIISQFVPTTMIDIRPVELKLEGLSFVKANILNLPFEDSSIESISSLCVVEHIGLGRYGDHIDSFGSEKAIKELKRVLKKGGVILFSVPIDSENKIYFNAHRSFTRSYVLDLFEGFKILDEKYQYGKELFDHYDQGKGFGTGLFYLKKQT
jgi:hypothetical protein